MSTRYIKVFQQSSQTKGDGLPQPRVKYDDKTFQISLDAHMYRYELGIGRSFRYSLQLF